MSLRGLLQFLICLAVYLPHKRFAVRVSSVYKTGLTRFSFFTILYTEEARSATRLCGKYTVRHVKKFGVDLFDIQDYFIIYIINSFVIRRSNYFRHRSLKCLSLRHMFYGKVLHKLFRIRK